MKNKIVSKCGVRHVVLHANKNDFIDRVIENNKEEKPIQKKRTYKKVSEKLGKDFPAEIENENLIGVSD